MAKIINSTRKTSHGRRTVKINTGSLTGRQMASIQKKQIKADLERGKSSEAYKTARTKARSAAAATAVTNSVASREASKTEIARQNTQAITAQYAALINGNQGNKNESLPEDITGSKDTDFTPIPIN